MENQLDGGYVLTNDEMPGNKHKLEELENRIKELEKSVKESRRTIDLAISKYGIRA